MGTEPQHVHGAEEWDLSMLEDETEPFPDIHALFQHYNELYFDGSLGACAVQWSSGRMTMCAGTCQYQPAGGCIIKLSEPLLKYRPVQDLKDTLLHEMIHAHLFLARVRDDGDHGPRFQAIMNHINASTVPDQQRPPGGYSLSIYHNHHAEVAAYRSHVWTCSSCGHTISRAMNRRPQPADCSSIRFSSRGRGAAAWGPGAEVECSDPRCTYHMHLRGCGGEYVKVSEPEPKAKKASRKSAAGGQQQRKRRRVGSEAPPMVKPITHFFNKPTAEDPPVVPVAGAPLAVAATSACTAADAASSLEAAVAGSCSGGGGGGAVNSNNNKGASGHAGPSPAAAGGAAGAGPGGAAEARPGALWGGQQALQHHQGSREVQPKQEGNMTGSRAGTVSAAAAAGAAALARAAAGAAGRSSSDRQPVVAVNERGGGGGGGRGSVDGLRAAAPGCAAKGGLHLQGHAAVVAGSVGYGAAAGAAAHGHGAAANGRSWSGIVREDEGVLELSSDEDDVVIVE